MSLMETPQTILTPFKDLKATKHNTYKYPPCVPLFSEDFAFHRFKDTKHMRLISTKTYAKCTKPGSADCA